MLAGSQAGTTLLAGPAPVSVRRNHYHVRWPSAALRWAADSPQSPWFTMPYPKATVLPVPGACRLHYPDSVRVAPFPGELARLADSVCERQSRERGARAPCLAASKHGGSGLCGLQQDRAISRALECRRDRAAYSAVVASFLAELSVQPVRVPPQVDKLGRSDAAARLFPKSGAWLGRVSADHNPSLRVSRADTISATCPAPTVIAIDTIPATRYTKGEGCWSHRRS